MSRHSLLWPVLLPVLSVLLLLCGCGSSTDSSQADSTEPPVYSPLQVLVPSADGSRTLGSPPVLLDISNLEQGYMTAQTDDTISKANIQLTGPDAVTYSYFLDPDMDTVIPFTQGNGSYTITAYEQIEGSTYAALYCETVEVTLDNEFLPFLYPNQYVNFTPESEAAKFALSMLPDDAGDLEALQEIYDYVINNITYDEQKAETVEAGYLPDVDETLETKTGICFDYAALMTAMLRSRDIPCRLVIGYSNTVKHAWIDVYIRSVGWVEQAIAFDGETWTRMDPTFDSTGNQSKEIREYIGDGENYTVQFVR
jgi:transglutaminase-like putative cysteine protease